MKRSGIITLTSLSFLLILPTLVWGQDNSHHNPLHLFLEWAEWIVDLTGITILLIGFIKGFFVFIKWELDKLKGASGSDVYDDVVALRSTLGWYIILALDFLIISDILHSIISPQFEELINLGIIVVLRTAIGFFLGRELMELRHAEQEEREHETEA